MLLKSLHDLLQKLGKEGWIYDQEQLTNQNHCGKSQECQIEFTTNKGAANTRAASFFSKVKVVSERNSDHAYGKKDVAILHGHHHKGSTTQTQKDHRQGQKTAE